MSTQEEADTRILLHAAHATASTYKAVVVASEDTEEFVLCLAFENLLPCKVFVKSSRQTRTIYIAISKVVLALGSQVCLALPGLHAFTGCDSVSAFFGKGKVAALKIVRRNQSFQNPFREIGMRWELSDDLLVKLKEFTCMMYTFSPGTSYVNELRYKYRI